MTTIGDDLRPSTRALGTRWSAAMAFLESRGAAQVEHLGGDLLTHLVATAQILRTWRAPAAVTLAGLCHAAYGTDGFPRSLVSPAERDAVADAIGPGAEAITYLYGSCDRSFLGAHVGEVPLPFRDRFTGRQCEPPAADSRAFALLTLANELELIRSGALAGPATRHAIAELFTSLRPYAGPRAGEAADEARGVPA